jgi:glycosyltransferase involved in cell wall biosynthesis
MKIALFYIRNILACHYALFGYKETLERMGHEVLDCPFPQNQVQDVEKVAARMPRISELNTCDVVLSTYHEYVHPWLDAIYGLESWKAITVPVVARFDESMDRGDLGLPKRVPELLKWADYYSWPAAQDAARYGGQYWPYGADTTIFKPGVDKKYQVGFVGTLYKRRHDYLQKVIQHVGNKTEVHVGNVGVLAQDLAGQRQLERESTQLLAENYGAIRIFFCFPPMSNLLVEKIFEVMACDTLVFYPRLLGEAAQNLDIFEDGKHIVYYDEGFFADNGKQIRYFLEHPDECEKVARAGGELVRSRYTIEILLGKLLALAKTEERCRSIQNSVSQLR